MEAGKEPELAATVNPVYQIVAFLSIRTYKLEIPDRLAYNSAHLPEYRWGVTITS